MWRATMAGLFAAVLLGAFTAAPARAEVRLISQSVDNGYPDDLVFKLTAEADADITATTLRYTIIGSGTGARSSPEILTPATTLSVEAPVVTNSAASFIPVGSEIRYFWEITDAGGATLTTPEETFLYLPLGFAWQSVADESVEVWYYGDNEQLANEYLTATSETYDLMGQLLKTELPRTPARVILFASEDDLDPAKPGGGSGGFDDVVTICGQHIGGTQIVFTIPQSCGTPEVTDTARHEFTHILTEIAGEGPLGELPLWLNEGTAVLGQTEPGNGFVQPFFQAVEDDELIPFAQMAGRNNNPSTVGLYYGQSYFMVRYLIEIYGPEQFADLFAAIKAGSVYGDALQEVYGFDLQGFEDEFRQSLDLAPVQQATPAATESPAEPEDPATPASQGAEDAGEDDDLNVGLVIIIGAAVLFALLAVFFYLVALMFQRNRLAAAGQATPASGEQADAPRSAGKQPLPPAWRPPEMRSAPPPPADEWAPEPPPTASPADAPESEWSPEAPQDDPPPQSG